MKNCRKTGKINPILKIRIDNIQSHIDTLDKKYGFESRYWFAGMEIRKELVELRTKLIDKIS